VPALRPLSFHLTTERLSLRPWRTSDAEDERRLWTERDSRSRHVIGSDGRPTVGDLRDGIDRRLAAAAEEQIALLAIERRSEGDFIGYCGLTVGKGTLEEPEIAYELFRRVHGHGYATEAARAVLEAAATTGRTRLWATVFEWNSASLRVLDKLGFERTERVTADPERGDTVWLTRPLGASDF
jgi:RimJ/RimL family protein N-acetyltransferase